MPTVTSFPKVVEVETITDYGPDSGMTCPHCGAQGRYVTYFRTEGGTRIGAMRGCFSLFPKSKYAARTERILIKQRDAAKAGRNSASWDVRALDAIRRLPELGEVAVDQILRECDAAKNAYIAKRYGSHR